ncbi:hypothetical protein [Psychromonas antarctica]|uniref:hypothetical protein n=1 Tax=Psychromonas antarctica TaxID=67573 RepID=UPI001EE92391|nr:hypothetical protein [Psychromonas antarctica]MCG6202661.1 hypothetical protein [Psychromonas antarctica]
MAIDIEKINNDKDTIKKMIEGIERLGGNVPKLKSAVNRLEVVINTSEDIADAAEETRVALKATTEDLKKACGDDIQCDYNLFHQRQQNAVGAVFSISAKKSVANNAIRNILRRCLHEEICKRLEVCKYEKNSK